MTPPMDSKIEPVAWRYAINYGPDGEQNYANVYDGNGDMVGNLKTPHAIAIVRAMNTAPPEAALLAAEQRGRESERAQADFPKWATDEHIANGILEAAETIVQLVIHNQTHRIAEYTGAIQSYAGTLLTRRAHIAKFLAASK